MGAAAAGDTATLAAVWNAVPAVSRTPFAGPFLAAVYSLLTGDTAQAADLLAAAGQGSAVQQVAGIARLRRLRRARPDLDGDIGRLIAVLRPREETDGEADA